MKRLCYLLVVAPILLGVCGGATADLSPNVDDKALSRTAALTNISTDSASLNIGFAQEVNTRLSQLNSYSPANGPIANGLVYSIDEASYLGSSGMFVFVTDDGSIYEVRYLLRHRSSAVSERYSHRPPQHGSGVMERFGHDKTHMSF